MADLRDDPVVDMSDTVFFEDGQFAGKPCRLAVAPYLVLLHLSHPQAADAAMKLRRSLARHPASAVERDIGLVLSQAEWRTHLLACVALARGFGTERSMHALWDRLRRGSWASPQLAATAAYRDDGFVDQALAVIADGSSNPKSVVGLAALLRSECAMDIEGDHPLASALREAALRDGVDAGRFATKWLAGLRRLPRVDDERNLA